MEFRKLVNYIIDIILVIIIILLLLRGCSPKVDDVKIIDYPPVTTGDSEKAKREKKEAMLGSIEVINAFADVVDNVDPQDLCRSEYVNQLDQMGIRIINAGNKGRSLQYVGDGNLFPDYQKYQTYFDQTVKTGEDVRTLSNLIKDGKYSDAITSLDSLIKEIESLKV